MANQDFRIVSPHRATNQQQNWESYAVYPQETNYNAYPNQPSYKNVVVPPTNITPAKAIPKSTEERLSLKGTEKNLDASQISVDLKTNETILTIKTSATNYNLNYSTKDGSYSINDKFSEARYGAPGMETKVTSERNDNRYSMDIAHNKDGSIDYKIKLSSNLDGIKFSVGNETYVYKVGSVASTSLPSTSMPIENPPINSNPTTGSQAFNSPDNGSVQDLPYSVLDSASLDNGRTSPRLSLPSGPTEKIPPRDVGPIGTSSSPPTGVGPVDTSSAPPKDVGSVDTSSGAPTGIGPVDTSSGAPTGVGSISRSDTAIPNADLELPPKTKITENDLKDFKASLSIFNYIYNSPRNYLNQLAKDDPTGERLKKLQIAYDELKGQDSMKKAALASWAQDTLNADTLKFLGW